MAVATCLNLYRAGNQCIISKTYIETQSEIGKVTTVKHFIRRTEETILIQ